MLAAPQVEHKCASQVKSAASFLKLRTVCVGGKRQKRRTLTGRPTTFCETSERTESADHGREEQNRGKAAVNNR